MAQHTHKRAQIQAVTANRLVDGDVVYFTPAGGWSEQLSDAAIADDRQAGAALLDRAAMDVETQLIIEPYLFEVATEGRQITAVSVREKIRMAGPTVRPDLGKQALGLA